MVHMLYDPKWEVETPADIKLEPWQEILLKAADILKERGWTQDAFTKPGGSVCLLGALNRADNLAADGCSILKGSGRLDSCYSPARALAEAKIIELICPGGIPWWNDNAGRTKKQVLNVLYKVAGVKPNVV